jgi:hypothetical protein
MSQPSLLEKFGSTLRKKGELRALPSSSRWREDVHVDTDVSKESAHAITKLIDNGVGVAFVISNDTTTNKVHSPEPDFDQALLPTPSSLSDLTQPTHDSSSVDRAQYSVNPDSNSEGDMAASSMEFEPDSARESVPEENMPTSLVAAEQVCEYPEYYYEEIEGELVFAVEGNFEDEEIKTETVSAVESDFEDEEPMAFMKVEADSVYEDNSEEYESVTSIEAEQDYKQDTTMDEVEAESGSRSPSTLSSSSDEGTVIIPICNERTHWVPLVYHRDSLFLPPNSLDDVDFLKD